VLWYPTQAKIRLEWGTQPLLLVQGVGVIPMFQPLMRARSARSAGTGSMTLNVSPFDSVVHADFVIGTDSGLIETRVYIKQHRCNSSLDISQPLLVPHA
jgi:hypothetical protein